MTMNRIISPVAASPSSTIFANAASGASPLEALRKAPPLK